MSIENTTTENAAAPVMTDADALAADALARAPKPTVSVPETPETSPAPVAGTPADGMGLDSLNRPFDPAKFRPEKDSIGRWKNRNAGRSRKTPAAAPAPFQENAPPSPPASELVIPPEAEDAPSAPGGGDGGDGGGGGETPAPPAPRVKGDAETTAEAVCKTVYAGIGIATGHPEEATPSPAEQKAIKEATAAFLSARGWIATGTGLFVLLWALYLFKVGSKPETRMWLGALFGKKTPKNVTPLPSAPVETPPPASPSPPPPSAFGGDFMHL
ncbi:MAG: hypothetical protein LBK99_10635 [Opitutaceae bacterium]|nr:hypothetical protein [Opitutaceae bacterium]